MTYQYKLNNFLNKRYSLRNLRDSEFEDALTELSIQLETYDYKIKYSDQQLWKDWDNLQKTSAHGNSINSTVRHGMKLCEHFMDNFWEIKDAKGRSFANQWTQPNLHKVLRWNRKSHSTPYLSEIRRGVYFCTGMTKSTMFRPSMSKMISCKYSNRGVVLDPCAGWGGRMLGVVASGAKYIAFEPNTKTYKNLIRLVNFLKIEDRVILHNDIAENIHMYDISNVDLILTSPPYYNLEIYSDEETQSIKNNQSYDQWVNSFLKVTIQNCIDKGNVGVLSAWNVANFNKYNMIEDVAKIHNVLGFSQSDTFCVSSSKRQANQTSLKNAKKQ